MLTTDVSILSRMDESFGERVKRLRVKAGLSPQQFADKVGVSRPTIVMWENGQSFSAEAKNLVRAAEVLGVDPKYLQFGGVIGAASEPPELYAAQLATRPGVLREIPIIGFAIATPDQDGYFTDSEYPIGGNDGTVLWPTKDPNAYALRVKGDSMQPRIRPGELIIVEPNTLTHLMDDVLVVTRKGRKMVKQLLSRRGGPTGEITLGSINQAHQQITISMKDVKSIFFIAAIVPRSAAREGDT